MTMAKLIKVENKWMRVRKFEDFTSVYTVQARTPAEKRLAKMQTKIYKPNKDDFNEETDVMTFKGKIPVAIEHYSNGSKKIIICPRGHARQVRDEISRSGLLK